MYVFHIWWFHLLLKVSSVFCTNSSRQVSNSRIFNICKLMKSREGCYSYGSRRTDQWRKCTLALAWPLFRTGLNWKEASRMAWNFPWKTCIHVLANEDHHAVLSKVWFLNNFLHWWKSSLSASTTNDNIITMLLILLLLLYSRSVFCTHLQWERFVFCSIKHFVTHTRRLCHSEFTLSRKMELLLTATDQLVHSAARSHLDVYTAPGSSRWFCLVLWYFT